MTEQELTTALIDDELTVINSPSSSVFVHNEHRWVLCILQYARESGIIDEPVNVTLFDRHHDAVPPDCLDVISKLRSRGFTFSDIVKLCEEHLNSLNDDWIKAAMELGLVRDAVIFGVEDTCGAREYGGEYEDTFGELHNIHILHRPKHELGARGKLGDRMKASDNSDLCKLLGWAYSKVTNRYELGPPPLKFWLDIDLDFFSIQWDDYVLTWDDFIFSEECTKLPLSPPTVGWNMRTFIQGLCANTLLQTVAMEPDHCGGLQKSKYILHQVNSYLFESDFDLSAI